MFVDLEGNKMEKRMVIVTRNSETGAEGIWCNSEKHAKGVLRQVYLRELQKARYCDVDNTYITDNKDYAHIQNGFEEIFISICRTKQYGRRAKKKYKYKRRKHIKYE